MVTSTIYPAMRIYSAAQFKEALSEPQPNTKVYFTFGRPIAWDVEASPPTPNTAGMAECEVWRYMIGGKRLFEGDMAHIIPRYNWTSNTRYISYDYRDATLFNDNVFFYVVTSEWNVYKCLGNNNSQASTIEPTAINPNSVTTTADGYIWKYMYTVTDAEKLRFTTDNYIPVKTLSSDDASLQWDVQAGAVDGAIYRIDVLGGGANYTNVSNLVVSISGDGSGAAATANINALANMVHTITMTNYGVGYTFADITISGGAGTGASARAAIGPAGGHGSDPLYELNGRRILINPRIQGSESGVLPATNDFRQIALLKDAFIFGTANIMTNTAFSQTIDCTLTGAGTDYQQDEWVYQGSSFTAASFKGRVVKWDSANSLLQLIDTYGSPTNDALIGQTSTANKFVTSVADPDLQPCSGHILWQENIPPITRDPDQTEHSQVILAF
jgi:hypothetical protein